MKTLYLGDLQEELENCIDTEAFYFSYGNMRSFSIPLNVGILW